MLAHGLTRAVTVAFEVPRENNERKGDVGLDSGLSGEPFLVSVSSGFLVVP